MKKITPRQMAFAGIMAAMVYVASAFLQIPIPTAIGSTRLHMGNVMCLLSGFLLGPVWGGVAAGVGSVFFDLFDPVYITSAPFTFGFKFFMAWVCGILARSGGRLCKKRMIPAALAGAISYVLLYLLKSFVEDHFVLGLPLDAIWITVVQKGVASCINGVIAAAVSVPLALALSPAVDRLKLHP